jgi:hypothetical protein
MQSALKRYVPTYEAALTANSYKFKIVMIVMPILKLIELHQMRHRFKR